MYGVCAIVLFTITSPHELVCIRASQVDFEMFVNRPWLMTNTMTSWWARRRLKSPASRLFTQPFIQQKHQSSASLAFVRGIHWWPVNSPHKGSVTRKCFHLITSSYQVLVPSADVPTPNGAASSSDNGDVYTRKPSPTFLLIYHIRNHHKQSNHSQLLYYWAPCGKNPLCPPCSATHIWGTKQRHWSLLTI